MESADFSVFPVGQYAILHFLRSLRWPFREIFNFLFFFHVWLALRCRLFTIWNFTKNACAGTVLFLLPLILAPFSFSTQEIDRKLILSGEVNEYWETIKRDLERDDQIIAIIPSQLVTPEILPQIPYTLLGGCNYPALFEVRAVGGYTALGLADTGKHGVKPYLEPYFFSPQAAQILMKQDKRIKALEIVSTAPLKIQFVTANSRKTVELPPSLANRLPVKP